MGKVHEQGRRQYQTRQVTKQLKRQDRMSSLPDCLIIKIISGLRSAEEAIRTGILSKRWQHLWPSVRTLIFCDTENSSLSKFYRFVVKTMTQVRHHQFKKLEVFHLYSEFEVRNQSQVNGWACSSTSVNVDELNFTLRPTELVSLNSKTKTKFQLEDESIFINSCFTFLIFKSCVFKPTGPISWTKLNHISISSIELDEDLIQNILSGSPLLETLEMEYCYGFKRLDITSKSVKNLEFFGYSIHDGNCSDEILDYEDQAHIIEINAPYILSLKIVEYLDTVKLVLLDMSSLLKATLDYTMAGDYGRAPEEWEEEMLKRIMLSLPHVKELQLRYECSTALSRLKANGFIVPSNVESLGDYDSDDYSDDSELR